MKLLRLWIFPFIGRGVDSLLWSRYYDCEKGNKNQRMENPYNFMLEK